MRNSLVIIIASALCIATLQAEDSASIEAIKSKLETIILPDLHFEKTSLSEAIATIRTLSISADTEVDVKKKGVTIVLKTAPDSTNLIEITANLKQPTLGEAFAEIARQANYKVILEPWGVAIMPKD